MNILETVKYSRDPQAYFAEQLYRSMKGLGTNDRTLIRVMVTRADVDLKTIKRIFEETYGKTLASFIEGDTSGDYRRALLTLLGICAEAEPKTPKPSPRPRDEPKATKPSPRRRGEPKNEE